MSDLRVRAYNVLQGDAFLITVPDRDANGVEHERHILIDVGNLNGNVSYQAIVNNILAVTGNQKVDLYVMTHEHMDHVEGLYYAQKNLQLSVEAEYAWLTASAAPDYYDNHPDARRAFELAKKSLAEIERFLDATDEALPQSRATLAMNRSLSTNDCVAHLRSIAPANRTFYVHRQTNLQGKHPFEEADLAILAPEEDTSEYYLGMQATALGVTEGFAGGDHPQLAGVYPPAGIDAGAFYKLVECRRDSYVDSLLAIDKAKNNTSIVFTLKWRGWVLLFPGDAQTKSWQMMHEAGVLEPVDFLKVGHHGSHNATPAQEDILSQILPQVGGAHLPWGVIPVGPNSFDHPHESTLERLEERCEFDRTDEWPEGDYLDYLFPG